MNLTATYKSVFCDDNGNFTGVIHAEDSNNPTTKFTYEFACGNLSANQAMLDLDSQFAPIETALQSI